MLNDYPIDNDLLRRASMCATGADIHEINKLTAAYHRHVAAHNNFGLADTEDVVQHRKLLFFYCVQAERNLRGVVVEAELGRYRKLYPLEE